MLTWLDGRANGVNIHAAGLSQHDVVPEILHLHLLKVEHLLLALLIRDLLQLVRQAAQHAAPTRRLQAGGPAGIVAHVPDGLMAGCAQPVVEPASASQQGPVILLLPRMRSTVGE